MDNSILSFLIFTVAFYLSVLTPGYVLLYRAELKFTEKLISATCLGISLLAIQGFVFGYLGIRWFSYFYMAFFLFAYIFLYKNLFLKIRPTRIKVKIDVFDVLILMFGSFLLLSAVWFMGVKINGNLFFCCRGVPDSVYHLSLTNEIIRDFPPQEPGMFGVYVKNYHYFSNLVAAEISRLFNLNFIDIQYRYLNLVIVILLGISALALGQVLSLSKAFSRWLALFVYASGDILYLLLALRTKGLDFSVTIVDDATKLLAGPPRAFSVVLFLGALILFVNWIRKNNLYLGILSAIIMGSLIGFKVYTGIFALIGLSFLGFYFEIAKKFKFLLPIAVSFVLSFAYYFIVNRDAGGMYFGGLWRFHDFVQHKSLYIEKIEYLRLENLGRNNFLATASLEILSIVVFFLFLFGTLNFAFLQSKKSLKRFPIELHVFLIPAIIVTLILGSFFYQNTGGANTIQFVISAFIFTSIYAALSVSYWLDNKKGFIKYLLIFAIVLLTIPRAINEGLVNIKSILSMDGLLVEAPYLDAFNYIKTNTPPESVIALDPWMSQDHSLMYISFLTQRRLYLSGSGVLKDHGQDILNRSQVIENIYHQTSVNDLNHLLKSNGIDYVYASKNTEFSLGNEIKKEFDNGYGKIFKRN